MDKLQVKIKKTHESAVIPTYGTSGSACFDLTAISMKHIEESGYGYIEYDLGLAFQIPEGHVGLIYPRSSISKTGMILSNAVGIIDSDYRGTVTARFKWVKDSIMYQPGERCCQMMIVPVQQIEFRLVDALDDTERGSGAYGSTGMK